MRRRRASAVLLAIGVGIVLALGVNVALTAGTAIPWSVFGSGGSTVSSSASYRLGSTAGQTAIGPAGSAGFQLVAGFWYGACADPDVDGVTSCPPLDNCPNWPNPAQNLPAWPVPAGDTDCDGFPNSVAVPQLASEAFLGTDPSHHCAADNIQNNEPPPDKWPVDFNNDQLVSGGDFLVFAPVFGGISPDPRYNARYDLNGDGRISGGDFLVFSPFFGKRCA